MSLQLKQTNQSYTTQDNSYVDPATLKVAAAGQTTQQRFELVADDSTEYYTNITIKDVDLQGSDERAWLQFAPDINGAPGNYSSSLRVPDLGAVPGQPARTIYYNNFNGADNPTAVSDDPRFYTEYPYGRLPYDKAYQKSYLTTLPPYFISGETNWKYSWGIVGNQMAPTGPQHTNLLTPEQSKPADFSFWHPDPVYGNGTFVGAGQDVNGYASYWSDSGLPYPDPVIHLVVNPTGDPYGTPYTSYEAPVVIKSDMVPVDPTKYYTFEIGVQTMVYQWGRVVVYFYDSVGNEIGQKVSIDNGMPSTDYYYYIDWNSVVFGPGDYMPPNTAFVAFSWGMTQGGTFSSMEHIFEFCSLSENWPNNSRLSFVMDGVKDFEWEFDVPVVNYVSTTGGFPSHIGLGMHITDDKGNGVYIEYNQVLRDFGSPPYSGTTDIWPNSGDHIKFQVAGNQLRYWINGTQVNFTPYAGSPATYWNMADAVYTRLSVQIYGSSAIYTATPGYPYRNSIDVNYPQRFDNWSVRELSSGIRTSYPFWTKFTAPQGATRQLKTDTRIAADCIKGIITPIPILDTTGLTGSWLVGNFTISSAMGTPANEATIKGRVYFVPDGVSTDISGIGLPINANGNTIIIKKYASIAGANAYITWYDFNSIAGTLEFTAQISDWSTINSGFDYPGPYMDMASFGGAQKDDFNVYSHLTIGSSDWPSWPIRYW